MKYKGIYLFIFFLAGFLGFYYWLSTPQYSMGKIVNAITTEDIDELKKRINVREVSLLNMEKYFISSKLQKTEGALEPVPKYQMRDVSEVNYEKLGCSKVLCHYLLSINYASEETPVKVKLDLTKEAGSWYISRLDDVTPLEEYFSE